MRSHLYLPVVNTSGDIQSCVVRLLEPGTTTLINNSGAPVDVFSVPSGGTTIGNPFTPFGGVINVYLQYPRRVRLGITPAGQSEQFMDDVDIVVPSGVPGLAGGQGMYLYSPDGTRWALNVGNDGTISTAPAV